MTQLYVNNITKGNHITIIHSFDPQYLTYNLSDKLYIIITFVSVHSFLSAMLYIYYCESLLNTQFW